MSYMPMLIDGQMRVKADGYWRVALKRTCASCGKEFYIPNNRMQSEGIYCSRACANKSSAIPRLDSRRVKQCAICGDEFTVRPSQADKIKTCRKPECRHQQSSNSRTEVWRKKREEKMKVYNKLSEESRRKLVEISQSSSGQRPEWRGKRTQSKKALEYIKHNPGVTVAELMNVSGYATYTGCWNWVNRAVDAGKIKSKSLDGKLHLYANNYLFGAELKAQRLAAGREASEQPTPNVVVVDKQPVQGHGTRDWPTSAPTPATSKSIEDIAKQYAWEVNNYTTTVELKKFVDWAKANHE